MKRFDWKGQAAALQRALDSLTDRAQQLVLERDGARAVLEGAELEVRRLRDEAAKFCHERHDYVTAANKRAHQLEAELAQERAQHVELKNKWGILDMDLRNLRTQHADCARVIGNSSAASFRHLKRARKFRDALAESLAMVAKLDGAEDD